MSTILFAGIIRLDETDFAVGLRNYSGSIKRTISVHISGGLRAEDLKDPPTDFCKLLDFFKKDLPQETCIRLCVDFEGIIQPRSSPFSKLCLLLSANGFGALGFGVNAEGFFAHSLTEKVIKEQGIKDQIWILPEYTGRAWYEFDRGMSVKPSDAALSVAEIAMHRHLYYYLSSHGTVQSSMDVIQVLRHGRPGKPNFVITKADDSLEAYVLMITDETRRSEAEISEVSLEYMKAKKQFSYLHENQSLKFALLHVCRHNKLKRYCLTSRDDSESIRALGLIKDPVPLKEEYLAWPPSQAVPSEVALDFEY